MRSALRTYTAALRALLLATVVLGGLYTLAVTGIAQLVMPAQANGSVIAVGDETVGSALLGQQFVDAEGNPLPEYFQARLSAITDGPVGGASGGSNQGPENPDLVAAIADRRAAVAAFEACDPADVPVDAVTTSASGLDPHVSLAYALLQADRVAEQRGLDLGTVEELVQQHTAAPDAGFLGQERVNVLELNLALDALR